MGIFKRRFSKAQGPVSWEDIVRPLCLRLEHIRGLWFESSVRRLESMHTPLMINTKFEGEAEIAIKAFQLFIVSSLIATKQYVPPEQAKEFMNDLCVAAWGQQGALCQPVYQRYVESSGLDPEKAEDLCVADLISYVSGKEPSELERIDPEAALLMNGAFRMWSTLTVSETMICVAKAFNDERLAAGLREKIDGLIAMMGKFGEPTEELTDDVCGNNSEMSKKQPSDEDRTKTNSEACETVRTERHTPLGEVRDRIRQIKETNASKLDLSGLHLQDIRSLSELWELASLAELILDGNRLVNLPPEIGHLTNLATLSLNRNDLKTLPPEIGNLINLKKLVLSGNSLKALPPEIANLPNLKKLWLSDNPLETPPLEITRKGIGAIREYFRQLNDESEQTNSRGVSQIDNIDSAINGWSKKEEAPAFTEGADTWQTSSTIENVECGIGAQKRVDIVRANSLIRQERYGEAESILDSVLSWFKAHMNDRGKVYTSVVNREELATIEKEHPDQTFVWLDDASYGKALHLKTFIAVVQRNFEEALRRSDTVVQFRPYSAAGHIERGGILNKLQQPARALAAYQKALALAERFRSNINMRAAALRGIGFTHVELKDLPSARRAIEQSLKLEPDNRIAAQELNYIVDMEKE